MQQPGTATPMITRQLRRWSRISFPLIAVGIIFLILASFLGTTADGSLASRAMLGGLEMLGGALIWINALILAFLFAVWLLRWARIAIME